MYVDGNFLDGNCLTRQFQTPSENGLILWVDIPPRCARPFVPNGKLVLRMHAQKKLVQTNLVSGTAHVDEILRRRLTQTNTCSPGLRSKEYRKHSHKHGESHGVHQQRQGHTRRFLVVAFNAT